MFLCYKELHFSQLNLMLYFRMCPFFDSVVAHYPASASAAKPCSVKMAQPVRSYVSLGPLLDTFIAFFKLSIQVQDELVSHVNFAGDCIRMKIGDIITLHGKAVFPSGTPFSLYKG